MMYEVRTLAAMEASAVALTKIAEALEQLIRYSDTPHSLESLTARVEKLESRPTGFELYGER